MHALAPGHAGCHCRNDQAEQNDNADRPERIVTERRLDRAPEQVAEMLNDLPRTDEVNEPRMLAADNPPHEPEGNEPANRPMNRPGIFGGLEA